MMICLRKEHRTENKKKKKGRYWNVYVIGSKPYILCRWS
ncbi:hypothetical protein SNE40_003001 [Patella caerulea]|uniref:Uncharacterized protein n=1 Tax=Patella caerulea TaxID=87958 RepID=A0AAN8Q0E4_PATCE